MNKQVPVLINLGLSLTAWSWLAVWPASAQACPYTVTAGNDTITCTSGADGNLIDLQGDNTLLFPSGNATVEGVTYGPGSDLIELNAPDAVIGVSGVVMGDGDNIFRLYQGRVNSLVIQGSGNDTVQISGGQANAINQGAGADRFLMSAGTIASLSQGDGHDTFIMSFGTITGAFEDGDDAKMTGGVIGRVDMKLDNNFFDMSGGRIIGNLVTGFFNDTIWISGAADIGGNVSTSGGIDIIRVTGGTIHGNILASVGNDQFSWIDGGRILGFIQLGGDDDTGELRNLSETILSSTQGLDGGAGNDTLTLENTQAATPGRYTNWEQVRVQNNSSLALGGTLLLGDIGTGTGTLFVDASSKLLVDTGVVSPITAGQLATLNNQGTIDMTTGSSVATNSLTVNGNYIGNSGVLAVQTVLGADGSASDKLVVSQGSISGTTSVSVSNLGGAGAATLQDGIQVVQATNGAAGSTSASVFTLAGAVSAGAYNYYLFKGGVSAGTAENYYLRSTVPVAPPPDPDPTIIVPLPTPVDGTPPLPPNPGITPIELFRPEVSVYAALFPATQQSIQAMLATYHERVGDPRQQQQSGAFTTGWGRMYGSSSRQSFVGNVNPTLDSSITGFQVGTDVFASTLSNGLTQRAGFFVGHSRLTGNIKGYVDGWQNKQAGSTTLRGDSVGLYWTLINPSQAYLDLVVMGTRFNGNNESDRGVKMKTRGHNIAASAEVGWPFPLTQNWQIEPQAQVIVSKTKLDDQNDGISDVSYDADTTLTSRLGVRLRGDYQLSGMPLQPYARANVWHTRGGKNTVTFADVTDIATEQKSSTMNVSLGASLDIAPGIRLYSEVGYNRNLDSNTFNGRQGTVGLQMAF